MNDVIRDKRQREGAEAFVDVLQANDTDFIFLMPGTDTFPIQEALAQRMHKGLPAPSVVICQHETMAVAAAHGYFALTGRPQVVLVHVDVGTQMMGGMVSNAQRGRAGVVLCAGKTPVEIEGATRAGRSRDVHWLQDRTDQAGIVRDYVKWSYDLTRTENLVHAVQRSLQVATTEPSGPVYLTLLREVLMESAEFAPPCPERHPAAVTSSGDVEALAEVLRWLITAERPLLLTAYAGRHPETPPLLAEFVDLLAIPVVEQRVRVNLATDHPMHQGFQPHELLPGADVIVVLDHDVPWIPKTCTPSSDCRIAHIDIDTIKQDIPVWGFPVDLAIQADSRKALATMLKLAREMMSSVDGAAIDARRQRLAEAHVERRKALRRAAEHDAGETPMSVAFVAQCINDCLPADSIVLDDAVTSSPVIWGYIESRHPLSFLRSGGSSMGWGQGAAIGAKLAAPDSTVVVLDADGNFMDSSPLAPLWAAHRYRLPYLTVIFNNGAYNAVLRNLIEGYADSQLVRSGDLLGIDLREPPDFAAVAQACGAHGETVRLPSELEPALMRALMRVADGQAALVDVHIRRQ